jgi:hypothetical protein
MDVGGMTQNSRFFMSEKKSRRSRSSSVVSGGSVASYRRWTFRLAFAAFAAFFFTKAASFCSSLFELFDMMALRCENRSSMALWLTI